MTLNYAEKGSPARALFCLAPDAPGNLKFNGEFVRQVLGEAFLGGCFKDRLKGDEKA
jgi:hypothetical protein